MLKTLDNLEYRSKMTRSIFEAEKKSILVQMREPMSDLNDVMAIEEAANNDTNISANEA